MRILSFVKTLVAMPVLSFVLMSCSHPLVENGVDLAENERVWQYCKAFSLYGDRLPNESVVATIENPAEIVEYLRDTLYSWAQDTAYTFGHYYPSHDALAYELGYLASIHNLNSSSATIAVDTLDDTTAYLWIESFSSSTSAEVSAALPALIAYPNIVVDLRGNGGGYVNVCRAISECFLAAHTEYLRVTYRNDQVASAADTGLIVDEPWISGSTDGVLFEKKVAILIDGGSASASEIMAEAVHDGMPAGRCALIGTRSFGKGIGQSIFSFDQGEGGLKITSMRFTPLNGVAYNEIGIVPDRVVPFASNSLCFAAASLFFNNQPAARSAGYPRASVNKDLPAEWGLAIVTVDTVH